LIRYKHPKKEYNILVNIAIRNKKLIEELHKDGFSYLVLLPLVGFSLDRKSSLYFHSSSFPGVRLDAMQPPIENHPIAATKAKAKEKSSYRPELLDLLSTVLVFLKVFL